MAVSNVVRKPTHRLLSSKDSSALSVVSYHVKIKIIMKMEISASHLFQGNYDIRTIQGSERG